MRRLTILLLLASTAVFSATQEPLPGEQNLPATDLNRESNNPAKAAIKARQAQEADRAKQEAVKEDSPASSPGPVADSAQWVQPVEAALRKDARTAKLSVTVKLDEANLIGLYGTVSSVENRNAVIAAASKVAGVARVKSYLVVRGSK